MSASGGDEAAGQAVSQENDDDNRLLASLSRFRA